ncbi:MAG: hypothetical protein OXL37_06760 [Chloroflexota bacterium]|nr:hypothetical protein [Chloroflexota bacterium]MDE2960801.1 hypothetical protein [Chloroflexota bacterium]
MPASNVANVLEAVTDAELAYLSPQCRMHATASPVLLRKAQEALKHGELRQACVYAWGAVEEITKAVAENWKDYDVICERYQDMSALVNALSVTDPEIIKAIERWRSDYDELGAQGSRQALNDRLEALGWDWEEFLTNGFSAATNLLECFSENRVREVTVEASLNRIERYIAQMQHWLLQPSPPDGFRQFHNQ